MPADRIISKLGWSATHVEPSASSPNKPGGHLREEKVEHASLRRNHCWSCLCISHGEYFFLLSLSCHIYREKSQNLVHLQIWAHGVTLPIITDAFHPRLRMKKFWSFDNWILSDAFRCIECRKVFRSNQFFLHRWERLSGPQVSVTLARYFFFHSFWKTSKLTYKRPSTITVWTNVERFHLVYEKYWQCHKMCKGIIKALSGYKIWKTFGISSFQDFLLAGLSSYELGCMALEQGVLMERAGFSIWVTTLSIASKTSFDRQCHCSWWWCGKWSTPFPQIPSAIY